MKLGPLLAVGLLAMAVAFAAGGYFAPPFLRGHVFAATPAAASSAMPGGPLVSLGAPAMSSPLPSDLATILKEPNNYQMTKDLAAYTDRLSASELPGEIDKLAAMKDSRLFNLYPAIEMLTGRWVLLDPQAAKEAADKTRTGPNAESIRNAIMGELAARDPTAMWAQAQQMPPGPKRDQAMQIVLSRMGQTDPDGALALVPQLNSPQARMMATQSVISAMAQNDPNQALQAAQQLPAGQVRDQALSIAISNLANTDPAQALSLSQSMKTPSARNAVYGIFNQWAGKDLGAATQAALQLPDRQQRSSALQSIMNNLTQAGDMKAAQDWLNQVPAGGDRMQAEQSLVGTLAQSDPKGAAAYLDTIQNGQEKNNLVQSIAYQWAQTDAAGALAWIGKLPASQSRQFAL
ncbi:MAG TPA: hypothetical protein VHY09_14905, partial [Candidatus Methylacidiphilales bacterium]|nr:hypothetical protein [Candidatus Methylacidiphilales bacterium]